MVFECRRWIGNAMLVSLWYRERRDWRLDRRGNTLGKRKSQEHNCNVDTQMQRNYANTTQIRIRNAEDAIMTQKRRGTQRNAEELEL